MKKRLLPFSALLLSIPLLLTSCDVHWGSEHADVPWYVIAIPVVLFLAICYVVQSYCLTKHSYKCPECGEEFHPKMFSSFIPRYNQYEAFLKCPRCGKHSFCRKTD